ncbi:MAG: hypothetical protein QW616_05765 [Thermoplasmata archaeon]
MTLIERKLQKLGISKSIAAATKEVAYELRASKNQQFIILKVDLRDANFNRVSGIDITLKRVIGTIEQIVNPVIDSSFAPIELGNILYAIRGIPAEKGMIKEGLVIPEMSSLRIELTNKTTSAINYNLIIEYIDELYSE